MCERCDEDAERVAGATHIPLTIVKEVQAGFKALIIEEREQIAALSDAEVAEIGMEAMQEDESLDILALLVGGPFLMIRLIPVPGRQDGAMSLAMHAQGMDRERTIEILEATLLSAKSPDTGGVTDTGIIVSPGVHRSSDE